MSKKWLARFEEVKGDRKETKANPHLIEAAVNACVSVNPDNPMAVAWSIKEMYEALRAMIEGNELDPHNQNRVWQRGTPSTEAILKAFRALAKAEGKEG